MLNENDNAHRDTLIHSQYQKLVTEDPFVPNVFKYPVFAFFQCNLYFLILKLDYTNLDTSEFYIVTPPTREEIKSFRQFCKTKLGCKGSFQNFMVPG